MVAAGAHAIHLEEPEFWVRGGYGKGFEQEWVAFYGEPWQNPVSSPDVRYWASKLQQHLYTRALTTLCHDLKAYAREKSNRDFRCYVPTHSLLNYADWRIVSPESRLMEIEDCDGMIAQVWRGTAGTPNYYRGILAERTFETAFCEYGSAAAIVRGSSKRIWFLADPIEDNPNCAWDDYRRNWECTVTASLFFPEVSRFEVVPWPRRVYTATYLKARDLRDQPLRSVVEGYITRLSTGTVPKARENILEAVDQLEHFVRTQAGKPLETLGFGAMPPHPDEVLRFGDLLAYAFPFYQRLNAALDPETAERLRDALSDFYHDPTEEREGIPVWWKNIVRADCQATWR